MTARWSHSTCVSSWTITDWSSDAISAARTMLARSWVTWISQLTSHALRMTSTSTLERVCQVFTCTCAWHDISDATNSTTSTSSLHKVLTWFTCIYCTSFKILIHTHYSNWFGSAILKGRHTIPKGWQSSPNPNLNPNPSMRVLVGFMGREPLVALRNCGPSEWKADTQQSTANTTFSFYLPAHFPQLLQVRRVSKFNLCKLL